MQVRRLVCFVVAGGTAYGVDVGVLWALMGLGLPPLVARVISISVAMVVAWVMNRTLTFKVRERPTLAEFGRYAALAWSMAALNYGIFAVLIWLWVGVPALPASAVATGLVMVFSFMGMGRWVWGKK